MNQLTGMVLAVSFLSVMREKQILPFLIIIAGSFITGSFAVVLVAALTLLYRSYFSNSQLLHAKDGLGLLFMISGAALPSPYHELLIFLGVLIFSINLGFARLPLFPALLFVYDLFGTKISVELVLGSFTFYLVVSEALFLFKSKKRDFVLRLIEIPVLGILFTPFTEYFQVLAEADVLLSIGVSVIFVLLVLSVWIWIRKPDFNKIYLNIEHKVQVGLNTIGAVVQTKKLESVKVNEEGTQEFRHTFKGVMLGVFLLFVCWLGLVLVLRGGLS